MKRDPGLASLSRDHHHALTLARSLKLDAPARVTSDLPREPSALIQHVRERFAGELVPHFAVEERELIPACEAHGEPLRSLAQRVLSDHEALRSSVAGLASDDGLAARLDAFARLLEEHVRFEERSWFVALEAELGAEALCAMAPRLQTAATSHAGGPEPDGEGAAWSRMSTLPDGLEEYKRTGTFDPDTTPAGLRRSHALKADAWGQIVIVEGRVLYVLEDDDDVTLVLTPDRPGVVAPERPHHVVPQPGSRFFVRFLRAPVA